MSQNTTPPTTNGPAGTDPQAAARAATNEAAGTSVEASRSTGADILDWPQWIDGERVDSVSGQWRDVTNPALRDSVIARVPASTVDDVERVVGAARRAFGGWAAQHFTRRARPLALIADDIEAETEEFARLTALDTGNAIRTQARPEVASLVSLFRYFSGVAGESKGTTLPAGDDQLQYTRREPLGVVAAILPWNSPLMIAAFKTPAA
ncbi:MAG: aldehyde dehydrogenase family protein, partial [Micrococcaceae bacterium]|nr:aldehyde dehydrogenase family protein [Micrococcaceae bacterium]